MSDPREVPLELLDIEVRRAVEAARNWQESLDRLPFESAVAASAPLARHRAIAGLSTFERLGTRTVLPHEADLRDGVRRWVGALTVLRVTEPDRAEEAKLEGDERLHVRLETVRATSFRAACEGLVGAESVAEGSAWLAAMAEGASAVAAARRERAVREEEVVGRLGHASFAELVGGTPHDVLDPHALSFLSETRDLARSLRKEAERRGGADTAGVFSEVRASVARDAREGWPARLTLRALVETLRAPTDIGRGLRVHVAMPRALGAASFAVALERFGESYRRAAAEANRQPYATSVPPWFVDAHRFGFVFGSLPTMPAYYVRGLGLSPQVAADQARALARTALLHARTVAMTCLFARNAARPSRSQHEELTAEVFGQPIPTLLGAFPEPRDAAPRLQALLTTLPLLERLRDDFEEDWFRNPRAWQFLRIRASEPISRSPSTETNDSPEPSRLARAFEKALG